MPIQQHVGEFLVTRLVEFVRLARENGFQAGLSETIDAIRVAEQCIALKPHGLHWALRALLCGNFEDWRRFDQLFGAYWHPTNHEARLRPAPNSRLGGKEEGRRGLNNLGTPTVTDQAQYSDGSNAGEGGTRGGASAQASTAHKDFRFLSAPAEIEAMEQLVQRLACRMRRMLRRRWRIASEGNRLHLRHTIRYSLRYGGTPLEPVYSQRRRQQPRLILLLDVSKSMNLYSYFFLRFVHGVIGVFHDAHAFAYHTHLVPITEALRERDSDKLKNKLAVISLGWAGGTRIGECLQVFNQKFGGKLASRRAVVILVSDGLDTGPPALLTEQLKVIKQRARKLIWLNPLLGREGYQPLAGGMAAALPLIDVFASAHNLETLAALEPLLVTF